MIDFKVSSEKFCNILKLFADFYGEYVSAHEDDDVTYRNWSEHMDALMGLMDLTPCPENTWHISEKPTRPESSHVYGYDPHDLP